MAVHDGIRARVAALQDEGMRLYAAGELAAAIERSERACELVRELIAAGSPTAEDRHQLGAMLYMLGEWLREASGLSQAVAALDEAESVYGELRGGEVDADQLIIDVVIRRARVHTDAGRPLSAVADAQRAVMDSLQRLDEVPRSPRRLDAARVVAHAAQVQMLIGADPDLAVAAADWAIREVISGFGVGDQLALTVTEAQTLHIAARIACVLHAAAGRDGPAQAAKWFATVTAAGDPDVSDETIDMVRRTRPTLATGLAQVGQDRYIEVLTAPPMDVRLLVPAQRVHHSLAAGYAAVLAELQIEAAFTAGEFHERLFALEAHALFAWASMRDMVNMRYQFQHFGVQWLSAVINFGQRHRENDQWSAAVDAAAWLTGIVGQLMPHAMINTDVRRNVLAALDWQRQVYTAVGDSGALREVERVVATVLAFDDR